MSDKWDEKARELGKYFNWDNNSEQVREIAQALEKAFAEGREHAFEEIIEEQKMIDVSGIHSCHDNCQRPKCVERRLAKAAKWPSEDEIEEAVDEYLEHEPGNSYFGFKAGVNWIKWRMSAPKGQK